MRVVVTGGAGFIGSNLCRSLLATPQVDDVVVLDDLSTGDRTNVEGLPITFVEGTILDGDQLDRALEGADSVVHLAALGSVPRSVANPMASHLANATGTAMVLEAARRHGGLHTIVASSSSVYGATPTLPKHEDLPARPMSPYAASKLATEAYTLAWAHAFGLPTLAFRFFNVFGPRQRAGHVYAAVVPAFLDAALRGDPVTVHGDGGQSRDFTYVGTVTAVITVAVVNKVTMTEPVNLAYGTRITLLEVLDELERLLDHRVERNHVAARVGDVRHTQADNGRLLALFPEIAPTPFAEGLHATAEWMRSVIGAERSAESTG